MEGGDGSGDGGGGGGGFVGELVLTDKTCVMVTPEAGMADQLERTEMN